MTITTISRGWQLAGGWLTAGAQLSGGWLLARLQWMKILMLIFGVLNKKCFMIKI